MSHQQGQSYTLRADSPPLIERIPTPPQLSRVRTSRYRSDDPPLITRVPTPPLRTRSLQTGGRGRSVQSQRHNTTISSRLYNLFRPRQHRVEIVETPIRRRRAVIIQQTSSSPPPTAATAAASTTTGRRHRPTSERTTPPLTPTSSRTPHRVRRSNRMSPQIPNFVPLPTAVGQAEPTPPASKERPSKEESSSPRRRTEYHAEPFDPQERVIGAEQPSDVTESRPVRHKPGSREANLLSENQTYREQIRQKDQAIENFKARQAELQERLTDARDQVTREKRNSNDELSELRFRLQQCLLDRDERQRTLEQRDREIDHLRRERQRSTVVIHDDDDRRSRPTGQNTGSSGLDAIREAQAEERRRGGYRGY